MLILGQNSCILGLPIFKTHNRTDINVLGTGYPAKSSASIFVKTRRKHSFDLEMVGNEIYYYM